MGVAISVLLPTIRPTHIDKALASIPMAAGPVECETIVVADFPRAKLPAGVRWIERERRGVIDAIHVAECEARGDYLFIFNDESVLGPLCLASLYAVAQARGPRVLYTPVHRPPFPFVYYGKAFAPFPFVHRSLIAQVGGLFDPTFKGFYADPDFCLRCVTAGVPIQTVESAVIYHTNRHDVPHFEAVASYLAADRAEFRRRWDHLGPFKDP